MINPKIPFTFLITSHNEGVELRRLVSQILPFTLTSNSEIVIVDDFSSDPILIDVLKELSHHSNVTILLKKFNNSFADQKNYGLLFCKGRYIIQLDADEFLASKFLINVQFLISSHDFDLLKVPRVNIVNNLSTEDQLKWSWLQNEHGWINWPDWQSRVFRNTPTIRYNGAIHESPQNCEKILFMDPDASLSIIHIKELQKQNIQNELYEKISNYPFNISNDM